MSQFDVINTAAGAITFVLLLATAGAGFIQVRHMRAGNELAAVLAIERDFRAPDIQFALLFVARELAGRMADSDYRRELETPGYVDPHAHPEMVLCNWFNRTGALVRAGLLDERLVLRSFGRLVSFYWTLLSPAVAVLRRSRGPVQYAGFEYLAYRADARGRAFGAGPRGLPVTDPWRAEDAARL